MDKEGDAYKSRGCGVPGIWLAWRCVCRETWDGEMARVSWWWKEKSDDPR